MCYPFAMMRLYFGVVLAACLASSTHAEEPPAYGPELQGFDYPAPVSHHHFTSQGDDLDMAYIDVTPAQPNGRTAVLLHGKNFCAATWRADDPRAQRCGLSGDRARPDRVL